MDPFGAILGAGGALLNFLGGKSANEKAMELGQQNIATQREFAQQGIRWKVADAKAAGIHPLYALGANTTAFAPVSVGQTNELAPLGDFARSMGQDLTRAAQTTRTGSERADAFTDTQRALTTQNMTLQNELLGAQIAKIRASLNPPMPTPVDPNVVPQADKYEDRPMLIGGGGIIQTDPRTANAEDFEKRYGEVSDWVAGPYIAYRDYMNTTGAHDYASRMNPFHTPRNVGPVRQWVIDRARNQYEGRR